MTMAWRGYGKKKKKKNCSVNEDTSSRRKIFVSKVFDKLRNEKLKLFKTKSKSISSDLYLDRLIHRPLLDPERSWPLVSPAALSQIKLTEN